jgi:hypothetical protein
MFLDPESKIVSVFPARCNLCVASYFRRSAFAKHLYDLIDMADLNSAATIAA